VRPVKQIIDLSVLVSLKAPECRSTWMPIIIWRLERRVFRAYQVAHALSFQIWCSASLRGAKVSYRKG
jgi:hypothetical protein